MGLGFSYIVPADFESRLCQLLINNKRRGDLADAFMRCECVKENLGNAYRAGIRGDNWDMEALDFTLEGDQNSVDLIRKEERLVKEAIDVALKSEVSGLQIRNLYLIVKDAAMPISVSNEDRLRSDVFDAEEVLTYIVRAGEKLCCNDLYSSGVSENRMNDFLRDILDASGRYEVRDQARHGVSPKGKDAGEVDLLILKDRREVALIEGMKLSSVDTAYIDAHLTKALFDYNPLGTATFIVAYVETSDFASFWGRYESRLEQHDYGCEIIRPIGVCCSPNEATRVAKMTMRHNGYSRPVYFVAFWLGNRCKQISENQERQ